MISEVALLGAANSIHIIRWTNGLAARGIKVHLISCQSLEHELDSRVTFHSLPGKAPFAYFGAFVYLRRLLSKLKPDLLNAHYATGYGLLARLSGFKPVALSVWGSDVYEFPQKSILHRMLVRGNLKSATTVASTSHCMARQTATIYLHPNILVTPFGIDESRFKARSRNAEAQSGELVIGTVKALKPVYGIDILVRAFALAVNEVGRERSLRLSITGGGSDLAKLKALANDLGVSDLVVFHGEVPHERVPEVLDGLDIYVALSRSESFGVAILEASACEVPVIVSDADGPAEVTINGTTGYIVPKSDAHSACDALVRLIRDTNLRSRMGKAGRLHVLAHFTWDKSLESMLDVYRLTMLLHSQTISPRSRH